MAPALPESADNRSEAARAPTAGGQAFRGPGPAPTVCYTYFLP